MIYNTSVLVFITTLTIDYIYQVGEGRLFTANNVKLTAGDTARYIVPTRMLSSSVTINTAKYLDWSMVEVRNTNFFSYTTTSIKVRCHSGNTLKSIVLIGPATCPRTTTRSRNIIHSVTLTASVTRSVTRSVTPSVTRSVTPSVTRSVTRSFTRSFTHTNRRSVTSAWHSVTSTWHSVTSARRITSVTSSVTRPAVHIVSVTPTARPVVQNTVLSTKVETIVKSVAGPLGGISMARFINLECYTDLELAEMPFVNYEFGFLYLTCILVAGAIVFPMKRELFIDMYLNVYMYYAAFIYRYIIQFTPYAYICVASIVCVAIVSMRLSREVYHPASTDARWVYYTYGETLITILQSVALTYRCDDIVKVCTMSVFLMLSLVRPYTDTSDNVMLGVTSVATTVGIYIDNIYYVYFQIALSLLPIGIAGVKLYKGEETIDEPLLELPQLNPLECI